MNDFFYGLKKGIPIALGYFAVSFSFGVMCNINGISPLMSILISATNLSSAGQYAGIELIARLASYLEIFLTVLLINIRYSLMSLSLSQKISNDIPYYHRLIFGFGITDEIYAVSITETKEITPKYMYGLILLPFIGWVSGTAAGVLLSNIMPQILLDSLGILLYAMFIAIIVPDMRRNKGILFCVLLSISISCILFYVPYINEIGFGFKIIIATIISALISALIFKLPNEVEDL